MSSVAFEEKFIGFVDLLGFKSLVSQAEQGRGYPLEEILKALGELGSNATRARYVHAGPLICPHARFSTKDIGFRLTQVSDCVVMSAEVSPAGAINLVGHCWQACMGLLTRGIMCRGYITRGSIYHTDDQLVGSGYNQTIEKEKQVSAFKRSADERGTPFIEIDSSVVKYIESDGDSCVKTMFDRMVKKDGDLTVLFPVKRLNHQFIVFGGRAFEAEKHLQSVRNVKQWVINFRSKVLNLIDQSNPSAMSKGEHYVRILDEQLVECEKTERFILALSSVPKSR
jgi:hypothetical protein